MSGHSKWATTKHKKAKTDAQRSKIFTKIGRELAIAVKIGGAEVENNPRLAMVMVKARANNMPNENISRSIKNAVGAGDKNSYEEVTYECYGPLGTAFIISTLTDNKNRTAGEIRHIFDKCGGTMGTSGCVAYMFERKGVIVVEAGNKTEDDFMMEALDLNVTDYKKDDDVFIAYLEPNNLSITTKAFEKIGYKILSSQIEMVPNTYIEIDENKDETIERLIEQLDDNEDVQEYFHNIEGF